MVWMPLLACRRFPVAELTKDEQVREMKALNAWAWKKEGEAIGRMDGSRAAQEAWLERAALAKNAAGMQPAIAPDADAILRELVVSIEECEKVECIDVGRVRRKRRDAAFAKAQAYTRGAPETDRAAMTSTTEKE
jgi:hypothetical protein